MISVSSDRMPAQPLDRLQQLGQLVEDLLSLEAGEPLQLHVEDRLRLDLREAELVDEARPRLRRVARSTDEGDDRVEVVERDPEPFEDVGPGFGLAQLELDAAPHDLAPEVDEVLDELEQAEHLRPVPPRWPAA